MKSTTSADSVWGMVLVMAVWGMVLVMAVWVVVWVVVWMRTKVKATGRVHREMSVLPCLFRQNFEEGGVVVPSDAVQLGCNTF